MTFIVAVIAIVVVSAIIALAVYLACAGKRTEKNQRTNIYSNNFQELSQCCNTETYISSSSSISSNDNNYRKLGGWLAFFAYSNLVGVIGIIAVAIWGIVTLAPLARYSSIIIFSILLIVGICAFGVFWWIKIFLLIKKKDCRILRFYEICAIVYVGYEILSSLSSGFTTNIISRIIVTLIGQLIIELYFRNSIRVRTYFGSGEFIRLSFFKDWGKDVGTSQTNYTNEPSISNIIGSENNKEYTNCVNCGAIIFDGDAFCSKCGSPKHNEFCKNCGAKLSSDGAFCSKCGSPR